MTLYEDLIPFRNLTSNTEMREVRERAQALTVLSKSRQSLTQRLRDTYERGKTAVVEVFFAQLVPNMLDGIQLGAVGRLGKQADILRDDQVVRSVPASPIHLHDNEVRGKDATDLLQEAIHHDCGGFWQNQRDHLTQGWGHRSIGIKVLSHHLCLGMGTHPWWCPAAFGATDAAKTAFVLRYDERLSAHLLPLAWRPLLPPVRESFF